MGKLDRKFSINIFSRDSIAKVKQELEALKQDVDKVLIDTTKNFAEAMIARAKENLAGTRGTGELANSIVFESNGKKGRIIVNADHGVFVEFGTGMVGQQFANGSIPTHGYQYNVGSKINENGEWVYYNNVRGKFYQTMGQVPKYYFYNAMDRTLQEVEKFWEV